VAGSTSGSPANSPQIRVMSMAATIRLRRVYKVVTLVYMYQMAIKQPAMQKVTRIQTGVRMEARLLKVLKALAELRDLTLGDLLEGIALHALEGRAPFSKDTLKQIAVLKEVYGLTLNARDSHRLIEERDSP
jgi:hypothetical protein